MRRSRRGRALSPTLATAIAMAAPLPAQTLDATLMATDPGVFDFFAWSLDVDHDTIAGGARSKDSGKGAVYVFRRGGPGWAFEQKLTVATAANQDQVGTAVGVSGDLLVAGAPDPFDFGGPASGPGAAYAFRRTGASWALEATLLAGDGQSNDQLGQAVAVSGDAALVGAPGDLASGPGGITTGRGAAYVFRNTGGVWSEEAKLVASDGAPNHRAGAAVDLDGDVAIVGAPDEDAAGANAGATYVFRRTGGVWSQEAKLVGADTAAGDGFGTAVSVRGDLAVIGAPLDDGVGGDSGSAYVFRNTGGVWSQEAKLTASDASAAARYGTSVAVHGERAAVGSPNTDAIYLHQAAGAVWSQVAKLVDASTILLGQSVALSADVIAGGAPASTQGVAFAGKADVWWTPDAPSLQSVAPASGSFLGGTPVTLTGTGFSELKPKSVTFGGTPATGVTWVSDTTIACIAPAGTGGTTVSVALTQNGVPTQLLSAWTWVGTQVTGVAPDHGPAVGGNAVTITGDGFVDNGSTTVLFGGAAASIVSITPPNSMIVNAAPGSRGTTVDVTVTSSNGAATLVGAYEYDVLAITGIDLAAGNLTGGQTVTVTVDLPTTLGDTGVTLGGVAAVVQSVVGNQIAFTVPPIVAADGDAKDIVVANSNGTATAVDAWTYTPDLKAAVTGDAANGGTITISWTTDPAVGPGQLVTIWLGQPLAPLIFAPIAGYAGRIQVIPFVFIVQGFPEEFSPLPLPFPPLPPEFVGLPFDLQGLATGEGTPNGSFFSVATFSVP